ncbi:hypothetical protein BYT27DRAFT_7266704 [Phlegmacium glaucopus]|nr:hypothetical protein BYT27DRAFT_7266704 [Phlegmacium glaucopus]
MERGDHMTGEELERNSISNSTVHAAAAAHHTPIANGPGPSNNPSSPAEGSVPLMLPAYAYISPRVSLASAMLLHETILVKTNYGPRPGVMVQLGDNLQRKSLVYLKNLKLEALVLDVEGTWRELTGVVGKLAAKHLKVRNLLVIHLYSPLTVLLFTRQSHWEDLIKQIEVHAHDEILNFKNTVNGMITSAAVGVTQVTLEVGSQDKIGGQAHVSDVEGVWLNLNLSFDRVNRMCSSLTDQVRSIAVVTTAVARSDLTQKIEMSVKGEMSTVESFVGSINSMVDQLSAFVSEVTRVALEVAMQGILGGQARVEGGVQGTWADLTRNINWRIKCYPSQKVAFVNVDVQEEMLDLEMIVNSMAAQLSTLANEVTQVSLEVRRESWV